MSTLSSQKTGTPKKEYWKAKKNDIILAVIGRTGAGKTNFIAHARNDPLLITSKHDVPRGYRLHGHPRFGERIVLVDTPGFDGNQHVEDEKVVKRIQEWYKNNYKASLLAGGILYIHNISDTRTDAASPADWSHLSRLFGPSGAVVDRLVVVMSHWHDADGNEALVHQFNERKEELTEKWKGLIGAEPKSIAFYDTPESVQEAIELLLSDAAVTAPVAARSTSPSPESKSQPRTPRPDSPPLIVPQPIHIQPAVPEPPPPVVELTPPPPVVVQEPAAEPAEVAAEPIPAPHAVVEEKVAEPEPISASVVIVAEEPIPAPDVKAEEPVVALAPVEQTKVESPPTPAAVAAEETVVEPTPTPVIAEPVPEPPIVVEEPIVEPVSVRLVSAEPLPPVEEPPVIPSAISEHVAELSTIAHITSTDDIPTPVVQEPTPAVEVTEPSPSSAEVPKDEAATSPAAVADAEPQPDVAEPGPTTSALEPAVEAPNDDADSKSIDNRPSTIKVEQPDEKKVEEKDLKAVNEKQGADEKTDEKTTSTISKGASEVPYGHEKIKIPWWRKLCCGCF